MEPEVDRLRRRVGQGATRGAGVTSGHRGAGPAGEFNLTARAAAEGAVMDADVVEMLGELPSEGSIAALLRPSGLPETDEPPEPAEGSTPVA